MKLLSLHTQIMRYSETRTVTGQRKERTKYDLLRVRDIGIADYCSGQQVLVLPKNNCSQKYHPGQVNETSVRSSLKISTRAWHAIQNWHQRADQDQLSFVNNGRINYIQLAENFFCYSIIQLFKHLYLYFGTQTVKKQRCRLFTLYFSFL